MRRLITTVDFILQWNCNYARGKPEVRDDRMLTVRQPTLNRGHHRRKATLAATIFVTKSWLCALGAVYENVVS